MSGSSLVFPLSTWIGGPPGNNKPPFWLDLYFGPTGLVVAARGDYQLTINEDNLRRSVLHQLITKPGDIKARPSWGVGIPTYLLKALTGARRDEIRMRIADQIPRNPRVGRLVDQQLIETTIDNKPVLQISLVVDSMGREQRIQPYNFPRSA